MEKKHYYTDERNAQIVIALLKAHGVRDLIISPGATNDCFVLSVQDDPDFTLYSAVDERHAGYLACGIAQESGRPVVINCTGATASRNYMPALTEAYYRKLPIVALTCSQHASHIGQMYPQMTDRIHLPADVVNLSVQCPIPHTKEEEWDCIVKVNRALLELTHRGGGPVHINLETELCQTYSAGVLSPVRVIKRVMPFDDESVWPRIPKEAKVLVWIGSHKPFAPKELDALDSFVRSRNAAVIDDITSNCPIMAFGSSLLCSQKGFGSNPAYKGLKPDLIIHIGEISGDYPTFRTLKNTVPVWRVSEDGELRDFLGGLKNVFEMPESVFFRHYATETESVHAYAQEWRQATDHVRKVRMDLPFSALWIAQTLAPMLPTDSNLHLGILNPLRCWNMAVAKVRHGFSTVGGFGIDGGTSSLIGSALASPEVLNFGVFGDLSFFYDLNALGSRHVGTNVRILLVNNGEGGEFTAPGNISDNPNCGERVHDFIAAKGHYGCQSPDLVRHFASDLGFVYLTASDKDGFMECARRFVDPAIDKPMVFECFTTTQDDRRALEAVKMIAPYVDKSLKAGLKKAAKNVLPANVQNAIRAAMGR